MKHIAKGIKFNASLEKLDLSGVKWFILKSKSHPFYTDNNVGDDARCLVGALKTNSTLKKLDLNRIKELAFPINS